MQLGAAQPDLRLLAPKQAGRASLRVAGVMKALHIWNEAGSAGGTLELALVMLSTALILGSHVALLRMYASAGTKEPQSADARLDLRATRTARGRASLDRPQDGRSP